MHHMLLLQSKSNVIIFLQLQKHLYIESLVGRHLFLQLSWKGGRKGEEK